MAVTYTPYCGAQGDKLYIQSGQFTSTLSFSLNVQAINNAVVGIEEDHTNTFWSGIGTPADKLYMQSGVGSGLSSTVKSSYAMGVISTNPRDVTSDPNANETPWLSTTPADELYRQSGMITSTMKQSISIGGVDTGPMGMSYDEDNTPWSGAQADKLYYNSGHLTTTLKRSVSVGGIDTVPEGCGCDGVNTPWGGSQAEKLYLSSGVVSASTLKDSEDVSGVEGSVQGVSTDDLETRMNYTPPAAGIASMRQLVGHGQGTRV